MRLNPWTRLTLAILIKLWDHISQINFRSVITPAMMIKVNITIVIIVAIISWPSSQLWLWTPGRHTRWELLNAFDNEKYSIIVQILYNRSKCVSWFVGLWVCEWRCWHPSLDRNKFSLIFSSSFMSKGTRFLKLQNLWVRVLVLAVVLFCFHEKFILKFRMSFFGANSGCDGKVK